MKRYWLVIPVNLKVDDRVNPISFREPTANEAVPAPGGDADAPARNAAQEALNMIQAERQRFEVGQRVAANRRGQPARQTDDWGHPVGTVYGFKMHRESKAEIDNCFEDPQLAAAYAAELASKTPGKQYAVFECGEVFETTTPTVIKKQFTASGELVLKGGEAE